MGIDQVGDSWKLGWRRTLGFFKDWDAAVKRSNSRLLVGGAVDSLEGQDTMKRDPE